MSKMHGRATIRLNGQYFASVDDATFAPGGVQNTGEMVGKEFFHSQTDIPSECKMKIPATAQIDLKAMQEITDIEVMFESDNGQTWIQRNAVQTGRVELQGGSGNGKIELTFNAAPAEKVE